MIVFQITEPSGERRIVNLAADTASLGRGYECDVRLDHDSVSKNHAEVFKVGNGFRVRDLGSYSGTYLNDRWITETAVKNGDTIRLGRFTITVLTPDPGVNLAPLSPSEDAAGPARPHWSRQALLLLTAGLAAACLVQAAALLYSLSVESNPQSAQSDPGPVEAELNENQPEAEVQASLPGDKAPVVKVVSPDSRTPLVSTAGPPPRSPDPVWLTRFRQTAEPILMKRCATCHDGRAATRFLVSTTGDERLRSRLNALALIPFLQSSGDARPLLAAHAISQLHGGGIVLHGNELTVLSSVLVDPDLVALQAGEARKGFWAERPPFVVAESALPASIEVFQRRVHLDLIGRPPTEAELEQRGKWRPAEVVRELAQSAAFRALWQGDPAAALRELWAEEAGSGEGAVQRLGELYERRTGTPATRVKGQRRLAASLVVDFWNRAPTPTELDLLAGALSVPAPLAGTLPITAFLLGTVPVPSDPDVWITRVFVRFLSREPTFQERNETMALLKSEGGARGLVMGLASSDAYRHY